MIFIRIPILLAEYLISIIYVIIKMQIKIATNPEVYEILSPKYLGLTMTSVFDPAFDDIPPEIPIFPLAGVLLLPQGKLPLNIFEPRYLNMTTTALGGSRLIGMVQPNETKVGEQPNVYRTGCAGGITAFSETEDGRYLITLNGV